MKYNKLYHMVAALLVVMLLVLTACSSDAPQPQAPDKTTVTGPEEIGEIYLYGEYHANEHLLQKELALWKDCYARGVRYLFVELPYYTAQYLNLWMQAEDDTTLLEIYEDWNGSLSYNELVLEFTAASRRTARKRFLSVPISGISTRRPAHAMRHTCVPRVS